MRLFFCCVADHGSVPPCARRGETTGIPQRMFSCGIPVCIKRGNGSASAAYASRRTPGNAQMLYACCSQGFAHVAATDNAFHKICSCRCALPRNPCFHKKVGTVVLKTVRNRSARAACKNLHMAPQKIRRTHDSAFRLLFVLAAALSRGIPAFTKKSGQRF